MHLSTLLLTALYILNIILILYIIFKDRQSSSAQIWAWVLVLAFIPVIGFFLYLLCGRGLSRQKVKAIHEAMDTTVIKEPLNKQKLALQEQQFALPNIGVDTIDQFIYMLTQSSEALYERGNHIDLYIDGVEKFNHVMHDIDQAKETIHLEYFCYESDHLGKALRDKLYHACKRGVKVKILLDGWGSLAIKRSFFKPLIELGAEVSFFMPDMMQANYRNHRKILVIDGKIGYIGGFNIADEYLGLNKKMGYWRDNHLRIVGPGVHSLQRCFLMDWNVYRKEKEAFKASYFPYIEAQGTSDIQIITSGPDTHEAQIKMTYLKMINMAKEEILIQTPYYIPDDALHEALKLALLSGINVVIQIPNKPDHILVYWATYSLVAELIQYGATIQIYDNGFIHAKTVMIDGKLASVGSANFDERSLHLNFEVNTVIYDRAFVQKLRQTFMETSTQCHVLTQELYDERSRLIKIKEGLARLISPIL